MTRVVRPASGPGAFRLLPIDVCPWVAPYRSALMFRRQYQSQTASPMSANATTVAGTIQRAGDFDAAGDVGSLTAIVGVGGLVSVGGVTVVGVTLGVGDEGGVVVGGGVERAPSEYRAMVTPVSMSERSW
jgi:hypothetical protein